MLRFKTYIRLMEESADLSRIDHGKLPTSFGPSSPTNAHKGSESGTVPKVKGVGPGVKKRVGTFAAGHKEGAPYAIPRHIPWVHHKDENGNDIITIHEADLEAVKNARPTQSTFHSRNFEKLEGEYISKPRTGLVRPADQQRIKPLDHLAKHGYEVRTTKNLRSHVEGLHPDSIHGIEGDL